MCHNFAMQTTPRISAIAAIGRNRELGKNGALIWRIPDDLKRLKALTLGHPLIMGRKTYESIGHPLPGRTTIIVTRNTDFDAPGCIIAPSLEVALDIARDIDQEEVFIFGGAEVYAQALPFTDRLYLTLIDAEDSGADTFFPPYEEFSKVIQKEERGHEGLAYSLVTLERAPKN